MWFEDIWNKSLVIWGWLLKSLYKKKPNILPGYRYKIIKHILDNLKIIYTGSGALASAWGMDKNKTNLIVEKFGIKIPKSIVCYKNVRDFWTN